MSRPMFTRSPKTKDDERTHALHPCDYENNVIYPLHYGSACASRCKVPGSHCRYEEAYKKKNATGLD